jgi:chromosome segregation ATPase
MPEGQAANVVTSENVAAFYAQRLNLAADDAPAEAAHDAEPAEIEQDVSGDEIEAEAAEPAEDAEQEQEQKPKRKPIEKRIGEVVKQREAARAEAQREREQREALEKRLKALEDSQVPAKVGGGGEEPKPEQFSDAFEYAKALAEYSAENALKERDKQEAEKKAAEAQAKTLKVWNEKLATAKAEIEDFEDIVSSSDVAVSDPVRDAILESDIGPKILYHLAANPEFTQALGEMSTSKALREIGKLEAKLETPVQAEKPAVKKPQAPAPINPIRATGSAADVKLDSDGVFHGSYQAWKAARLAGKIR